MVHLMAKKRKLDSMSSHPPSEPVIEEEEVSEEEEDPEEIEEEEEDPEEIEEEEEDPEEIEEEEEEIEYEEKECEEDEGESEEEEEEEDYNSAKGPVDDEGTLPVILASFSQEALIALLCEAAERHPDVAERVRESADTHPSQRKIFVHGLKWDTTTEMLYEEFIKYGNIENCRVIIDKITGKSKGYGFIMFKSSRGARAALKEPQKMINNRMSACHLASLGPIAASVQQPLPEITLRKIYVSNVGSELDPEKLKAFFSKYGEIEEGPLGLDKETGKPKGFCLFVYKTVQSATRALTEPYKQFEGVTLKCQKAIDGPKPKTHKVQTLTLKNQTQNQTQTPLMNNVAPAVVGSVPVPVAVTGHLMNPLVQQPQQGLNLDPAALGHALVTLMAAQGSGLNSFGPVGWGAGQVNSPSVVPGLGNQLSQSGYGNQGVGMVGGMNSGGNAEGFGGQASFPHQQKGRGYAGESQYGARPYFGR